MQAYDDLRCDVGYLFRYYVTNDQGAENDTWDEIAVTDKQINIYLSRVG